MEIKKREIICSIVIVAVMLIIGFWISENIRESMLERYQEYDTAIQIDQEEMFRYGMRTNAGNAFVYGKLKTLDPVNFSELSGEYSYIKKEEQKYRKHWRIVTETYRDSNGEKHTRKVKEEYWTWDTMRTETKTATKISYLNVEFKYEKIDFPRSQLVEILNTGYHRRNVYYGTGTEFKGTIFTNLKKNTINDTSFYENQTITETIENLESGYEIWLFWIGWWILTAIVVVGFCYLENRWLD